MLRREGDTSATGATYVCCPGHKATAVHATSGSTGMPNANTSSSSGSFHLPHSLIAPLQMRMKKCFLNEILNRMSAHQAKYTFTVDCHVCLLKSLKSSGHLVQTRGLGCYRTKCCIRKMDYLQGHHKSP